MKLTFLNFILCATTAVSGLQVQVRREANSSQWDRSPEEWQARWDALPTMDLASLQRSSLVSRSVDGNVTAQLDVCARVTACLGTAAATAAGYTAVAAVATQQFCAARATAMANALADNNYALAKKIISFTVVEVALPITINIGTSFFMNAIAQNDEPEDHGDKCTVKQVETVADQGGTATYGFCLQLRSITRDKAFSRVDYGTVNEMNDDVGLDMKMRFFISTIKNKHAAACESLGVWLKRDTVGSLGITEEDD